MTEDSQKNTWTGDWGKVHISVKTKLKNKSFSQAHNYLKFFDYTKKVRSLMIRNAKI